MSKELVLSTGDLQAAGINSQITSNDLLEVVAHDIYDKYMDSVNDVMKRGEKLVAKYYTLLDPEVNKMKSQLSKWFKKSDKIVVGDDDECAPDDHEAVSANFSKPEGYWGSLSVSSIQIKEKDRGTFVESGVRNLNVPNLTQKEAKIKLTVFTGTNSDNQEVKVGAITGTVETSVKKTFTQIITVQTTRFKAFSTEVK